MRLWTLPLIFALCVVAAFYNMPLLDRTESRVAVVAERMVQSGSIFRLEVPKGESFVAYDAKPPLHYWIVATCLRALQRSELSVRLPSLLGAICLLILAMTFSTDGAKSALILASSLLFYFCSGIGIIDMSLALALGVAMTALYRIVMSDTRIRLWSALLGLSMAWAFALKGLVGIAIPSLILLLFCVLRRTVAPLKQIGWTSYACSFAIPSITYYGTIEYYNPGFSSYFFINENILRFLTREYGDRTGSGHVQFYGASIFFFILAFLPWSPLLIRSLWRTPTTTQRELFLIAATSAPITLFIFARQHLATYQLPALLPAAVLLAERLQTGLVRRVGTYALASFTVVSILASPLVRSHFSSASLFDWARAHHAEALHFYQEAPLSAYWYSKTGVPFTVQSSPTPTGDKAELYAMRTKQAAHFLERYAEMCGEEVVGIGKWHIFSCLDETR